MRKAASVLSALMVSAMLSLFATPAAAVIKLDLTVAKIYGAGSKIVVAGTVAGVDADTRLIEVKVTETLKGQSPGERLRVQIAAPAEFVKQVAKDQPVLLFAASTRPDSAALIHLADTWLLAKGVAGSSVPAWRIEGVDDVKKQTFPGRTAALVRLVADLKQGKNTIIDQWQQNAFRGGIRRLVKLDVQKPRWILSADFNGDRKPDLLVGAAGGARLLVATDKGYEDATERWGLKGAGAYHAVGDVNGDGKLDLLLDDTLWINDGRKFTAATTRLDLPKAQALAAALLDLRTGESITVTRGKGTVPFSSDENWDSPPLIPSPVLAGNKKPAALLLAADGELRIFSNSGSPEKPWPQQPAAKLAWDRAGPVAAEFGNWGDTGKPCVMAIFETGIVRYALESAGERPADFERLTGLKLAKSKNYSGGLKGVRAVALDINGDGRSDLFAVCDTGGFLLVNRGFGTYLFDDEGPDALKPPKGEPLPFRLTSATPWTVADLHGGGNAADLLVLAEDGTLYAVESAPPKK